MNGLRKKATRLWSARMMICGALLYSMSGAMSQAETPEYFWGNRPSSGGPVYVWYADTQALGHAIETQISGIDDQTSLRLSRDRISHVMIVAVPDAVSGGKLNADALPFLSPDLFQELQKGRKPTRPDATRLCETIKLNTADGRSVLFVISAVSDVNLWPDSATNCVAALISDLRNEAT